MIIIAGSLTLKPGARRAFVDLSADAVRPFQVLMHASKPDQKGLKSNV
ncbi:MAG: hypothetical protein KF842_08000 [Caulobacter sp.]|nr:hypothetical protein [Caulobacter sp.]